MPESVGCKFSLALKSVVPQSRNSRRFVGVKLLTPSLRLRVSPCRTDGNPLADIISVVFLSGAAESPVRVFSVRIVEGNQTARKERGEGYAPAFSPAAKGRLFAQKEGGMRPLTYPASMA